MQITISNPKTDIPDVLTKTSRELEMIFPWRTTPIPPDTNPKARRDMGNVTMKSIDLSGGRVTVIYDVLEPVEGKYNTDHR